jgi:hypothetical protein
MLLAPSAPPEPVALSVEGVPVEPTWLAGLPAVVLAELALIVVVPVNDH